MLSVAKGVLSIGRLRGRGWAWLAVYLAAAAALLGLVAWQLVIHRGDLVRAVVSYVVPRSGRLAAELVIDRVFAAQTQAVMVNAILGLSLIVVQLFLFPLKEKVSATFEDEAGLVAEKGRALPLLTEAAQELGLFLMFLTAQMVIFWLGYSPEQWRKITALVLSYACLFASFGIDFISPVMQRHGLVYARMFKAYLRRPLTVLTFGAVFTTPVLAAAHLIAARPAWSDAAKIGLLFGVNLVCIAWAAVAGTTVGAQLLPRARRTPMPARVTRVAFVLIFAALFAASAYRFGALGLSMHHKSNILKCDYSVDWRSVQLDAPSLGLATLVDKQIKAGVSVEVTIENPTGRDVELEENRLEVRHADELVATARLTPIAVPAGQRVTQRIAFPVELSVAVLRKGTSLFKAGEWSITLWLRVAPGFDFPVYLVAKG